MVRSTLAIISIIWLLFRTNPQRNLFFLSYPFFQSLVSLLFIRAFYPYSPIMEHISTRSAVSSAMSKESRAMLVHFLKATQMTYFRAHFNNGWLHVKQFQNWFMF